MRSCGGSAARRVASRLAGLAGPLDADLFVGVPPTEQRRCATVFFEGSGPPAVFDTELEADARMEMLSYFNPPGFSSMGIVNTPAWRGARSRRRTARLGPRRRPPVQRAARARPRFRPISCPRRPHRSPRASARFHEDVTFGLGFKPTVPRRPFGPNPGSFGHFGTGGAVGFADPAGCVAFGYVMNHVIPRWQSTRNRSLIDALYRSF